MRALNRTVTRFSSPGVCHRRAHERIIPAKRSSNGVGSFLLRRSIGATEVEHEPAITWRQGHREKLLNRCPGEGRMLVTNWLTLDGSRMELNDEIGIRVVDRKQLIPDTQDSYTEFFGKLASCSVQNTLSRLELTPRKLPQPSVPFVCGPFADEISVVTLDDGGDNTDLVGRGHDRGAPKCIPGLTFWKAAMVVDS